MTLQDTSIRVLTINGRRHGISGRGQIMGKNFSAGNQRSACEHSTVGCVLPYNHSPAACHTLQMILDQDAKGEWDDVFLLDPKDDQLKAEYDNMMYGKIPESFTKQATCRSCGPIWLWAEGVMGGCPWCRVRYKGKAVPRPGGD